MLNKGIRTWFNSDRKENLEIEGDLNIVVRTVHAPAALEIAHGQFEELKQLVREGHTVNIFVESVHYGAGVRISSDATGGTKHVSLSDLKAIRR